MSVAASHPPTRRRRSRVAGWVRRVFFFALIAATAYLLYDRFGIRAWAQVELVSAARAWESVRDPAGSLIYEGDELQAAQLLGRDGWKIGTGKLEPTGLFRSYDDGRTLMEESKRSQVIPCDVIRSVVPEAVDRFHAMRDRISRFNELRIMPTAGTGGGGIFGGTGGGGGGGGLFSASLTVVTLREEYSTYSAFIFVHARRSSGGKPRLVIVTLHVTPGKVLFFRSKVIERFGVFDSDLKFIETSTMAVAGSNGIATIPGPNGQTRELVLLPDDPKKGVRLYAVQPGPADESRFFFDYEVNGQRGTIEGRLQADDTVQWQVLSGPAADPNWHADKLRPVP